MIEYNAPEVEIVETGKEDILTGSLTLPPMPFNVSNQDQDHE
jgi:hypothetical protein